MPGGPGGPDRGFWDCLDLCVATRECRPADGVLTLRLEAREGKWRPEVGTTVRDSLDLPPGLATLRPPELLFSPGEIYDFELTPAAAGELRLGFLRAGGVPDEWTWMRVEVR